jgi:glycosyltransferase involved in cell wall biosynthesis
MRVARPPFRAVRDALAAISPDVVHVHSPLVLGVLARRVAASSGVPVVYTNHYLPANVRTTPGGGSRALDRSFYSWVVGFANRCGYVTAPSTAALALLRERGLTAASQVISNGVDGRAFAPGPADAALGRRYGLRPGTPVILAVGRLSGEKRVDVLLEAAGRLRTPAQLAIAGAGPLAGRLRSHATRLGLAGQFGQAGRVVFLGHVPDADLPALYRAADVFAIASEAELQSLATMEAMASGLPVVAADACALGELVRPDLNGYLFAPGDAAGLAGYLDLLAADSGLRRRMGAESVRIITGHGRESTLETWEAVYGLMAGMSHSAMSAPSADPASHEAV